MKTIRSFLALTLAVILILSLAACGGNTKPTETTAANSDEQSAVQETEANSADTNEQTADQTKDETAGVTSKVLVAYFSATGTTKGVAEKIAALENADIYEIIPSQPYSSDDLNWNDNNSRSTKEQNDKSIRPEIGSDKVDLNGYDTIYLGFPIWWGEEPRIMDTFVESYDFSGKTIIPFCTSGGSGIGNSGNNLEANAGSGNWKDGDRLDAGISDTELQSWIGSK